MPTTTAASITDSLSEVASQYRRAWKRPWVHGEPLDDEHPCYLPMPYDLMTAIMPRPDLMPGDKKLFAVLLAVSWSRLNPARTLYPQPDFRAPARRLRLAVGQVGERKNHRLRASLERLASTPILPAPAGDGSHLVPPLSRFEITPTPDGDQVIWDHCDAVFEACAHPSRWHFLNLASCRGFRSKHALALYIRLAGHADLERGVVDMPINYLREWLGVGKKYADWHAINTWAVSRAVAEINEKSDIRVTADARPERWGRTIRKVVFTVKTTDGRIDALHKRSASRVMRLRAV